MKKEWIETENVLQKTFEFADFSEALAFVNKVGALAEEVQHHPDICIKDYRTVTIATTSHDAGNIVTDKDRVLAALIDDRALQQEEERPEPF
jgi:4a-hydroxytetrahydrobiopterin dehydratase